MPWYAFYTSSRHEKKVDEQMKALGFESFLPLVRQRRRWSDRVREIELPLFPGYVFANIQRSQIFDVLKIRGVVRILGAGITQPSEVSEEEILSVKRVMENGARISPCPYLTKGKRVRIVSGPLSGIEGILLDKKKNFKLVLSVNAIGQSAAVEIDEMDVEAV